VSESIQTGTELSLKPLSGLPHVKPGDDLAELLIAAMERDGLVPRPFDVLVLAQKIVSKAEGRLVQFSEVTPSARAIELAQVVRKDARLVELILSQSSEVVAARPGVLIVAHELGFVMANAGIDQSNVEPVDGDEQVLLLPESPDASCERLRTRLLEHFGVEIGVVISDSFGRPWRVGTTGVAIGTAGLPALIDCVGEPDLFGRDLRVTQIGFADEIAAAASLIMGQAAEGRPAVLVRGLKWKQQASGVGALIRRREDDMFRSGKP
jgi:coenzyme F420-0:L-glutamate ligase/coenzyme F420-1:gamma-L-glutamate ligase